MNTNGKNLDWLRIDNYRKCRDFDAIDWLKAIAIRIELSSGTAESPNIPKNIEQCLNSLLRAPCTLDIEQFESINTEVSHLLTRNGASWHPKSRASQIYVNLCLPDHLLLEAIKSAISEGRKELKQPPFRKQRYRWELFYRNGILAFIDALLWSEKNNLNLTWESFFACIDIKGELEESTVRKQCYQIQELFQDIAAFETFKEQAYQESGKK